MQQSSPQRTAEVAFEVGDMAVYPAHGVAEVTGIERQVVGGDLHTFYILRILDNGVKVMIPTTSNGLREIMSDAEVSEVFDVLKEKEISVECTTWNRRYREYKDKIESGDPRQIAAVLRDLYLLKSDKDLSFGERKMLDTAKSLLVKELSIAKDMLEDEIEQEFTEIFHC
jgi:CarD family transcriptional regulator